MALQVQAPAMYVPTDEQFWSKQDPSKPDIAFLKNHFYREGRLTEEQALFILQKCVSTNQSSCLAGILPQESVSCVANAKGVADACAGAARFCGPSRTYWRSMRQSRSAVTSMGNTCVEEIGIPSRC